MKTITIKTPLTLGDKIWLEGRVQTRVSWLNISINSQDSKIGRINCSNEDYVHFKHLTPKNDLSDLKELKFNCPFEIGMEVFALNSSYGNVGLLKKMVVDRIECSINTSSKYNVFHAYTNKGQLIGVGKKYNSVSDFKNRTEFKGTLKDNQKLVFTNYMSNQNKLVAVDVVKHSETHFKITKGYDRGKIVRGSSMYNSNESFFNKMLSQLD